MTAREPLADIAAEARQVLGGCADHDVGARLIGGLAVAMHQHTPTPVELQRSYADIDIVIGRKEGRGTKEALTGLGYIPNDRFNARLTTSYDELNGEGTQAFPELAYCPQGKPQTTLEPGNVGVELLSRAHRASHVKIPRVECRDTGWPATTRPVPPSAPTALCTTTR